MTNLICLQSKLLLFCTSLYVIKILRFLCTQIVSFNVDTNSFHLLGHVNSTQINFRQGGK